MTNLKKTLAVVLAFAMVISMGMISAFAYPDVTAGTITDEAAGILSNLGILTGFEDGTFRPDETVTRAQMAAIIDRTLGYESQAQSSMGSTVFNDGPADHWASGYINVAQAQGIINGYGDGNYGPEDQVTYEQAVKMIVSALGYDLVAGAKGGYPTGYLAIASSEGITKNANGKVGDAAKRGTVAILVYNALEVRLMDQTTWTSNGEDEYGKTDDTILSKYLEVQKWEGIVTDTPFMGYADGYDPDETPEIEIEGYYTEYIDGVQEKNYDESPKTADCSLVEVGDLFGKYVVAYIGEDEDDETGNIMVYAISEKQNKNKVTSISGTQLVDKEDRKEWNEPGQISYRNVGSTKVYDLDLDSNVKFYKNFEEISLDDEATSEDVAGQVTNGGRIDFISNDNDDKIEFVMITEYTDEAVIKEVTDEDEILSFETYNKGALEEIDLEDDDELVIAYKDGSVIDVKEIAENDTVSIVEIGKDVRILYVSSETVTGSVSSYDTSDKTVTISGSDYEISPIYGEPVDSLKDEEGIFFINVDGQIAWNETDTTASGNFGLILAADEETGISDAYVLQVAMQDGTIAEYDLASKAKFYDIKGKQQTADDEKTYEYITKKMHKNGKGTYEATIDNAKDLVFKFNIKNGEITKIKEFIESDSDYLKSNNGKKYDADSMSYGSADFDENTVVFAIDAEYVKGSTATVKDDDVAIGAVSAFFADEDDNLTFIAYTEKNKDYAGVIVGYDLKTSVPEDSDAVIISSVKTVTYDDDDAVKVIGVQGGKEVEYIIYDEDDDFFDNGDPTDLEKGDVILVSAANAEGVVSDFKLLFSIKNGGLTTRAAAGDVNDDIYNAVGLLNKKDTTNSKFYIDSDVENTSETWAEEGDGITIKASANYTLVDYTESTKNPDIAKKSSSSIFSTSSKYESIVFVRVYDDVLTEVVVYRFNSEDLGA